MTEAPTLVVMISEQEPKEQSCCCGVSIVCNRCWSRLKIPLDDDYGLFYHGAKTPLEKVCVNLGSKSWM